MFFVVTAIEIVATPSVRRVLAILSFSLTSFKGVVDVVCKIDLLVIHDRIISILEISSTFWSSHTSLVWL